MVDEGRRTSDALGRLPVELSGLTNVHRMAKTTDPRHFDGVRRAEPWTDRREGEILLDLTEQLLDRFRPDALSHPDRV